MKYGVLFGCAAAALIFAPVGASAAEGVSGGMSYAEIAGPVIGGIPAPSSAA
jgi:hypothetical protein